MPRPFEVSPEEIASDIDAFVDTTFADLRYTFQEMPRGNNFVEYTRFRDAYQTLKRKTSAFRDLSADTVWDAMREDAMAFVVLRTILGMTSGEWGALAIDERETKMQPYEAGGIDRNCRVKRGYVANLKPDRSAKTIERMRDMIDVACHHLSAGAPEVADNVIHRLNKVDTSEGLTSLQFVADHDVPYVALLYERLLGRPFATHRDTVSEEVGVVMENAVEKRLVALGIQYRPTGKAEVVPGFEQAPDLVIPDELAPRIAIEAKIANDGGTARDKAGRIRLLVENERRREARGGDPCQIIAWHRRPRLR